MRSLYQYMILRQNLFTTHKLLFSHHIFINISGTLIFKTPHQNFIETVVENYLQFGCLNDFREHFNCIMIEKSSYPSQYNNWIHMGISRVQFSMRQKVFLLTTTFRLVLGFSSPTPYPRGTGRYSPDIKWVGCSWPLPPNDEVKNTRIWIPTPHICLHGVVLN